jgi:hypothetical protein
MAEITFRDFAGALMGGDEAQAAAHLGTLLGVDAETARAGTEHFKAQMSANPAFMQNAMAMREVVQGKDRARLVPLLVECFALSEATAASAADTVLSRYA